MTGREDQRDVEARRGQCDRRGTPGPGPAAPDWTVDRLWDGLGDAVKTVGPPPIIEPAPDTPSPLEQMARAAELIRRRRIILICPTGRGGEFREVFAAETWAGLVDVVESDLLPDDGSVYVTRPGLLDIPDVGWPAPRIGGARDE